MVGATTPEYNLRKSEVRHAQQKGNYPTDGNGLLDYCTVAVDFEDFRNMVSSLNGGKLIEAWGKFSWCVGYVEAIMDDLSATRLNLAIIATSGVTFSGPDEAKQYALDSLRFACIPEKATILQAIRVLVKWLREHPQRLHEPKSILTRDALKEAFPCAAPATAKQGADQTGVKP
jgi:hypothetical protein